MSDKKLLRELKGDLKYLRRKAIRELDKLTITQGNIMLLRGRIQKLRKCSKPFSY